MGACLPNTHAQVDFLICFLFKRQEAVKVVIFVVNFSLEFDNSCRLFVFPLSGDVLQQRNLFFVLKKFSARTMLKAFEKEES